MLTSPMARFTFRLTEDDRDLIERMAEHHQYANAGELLRELIRFHARKDGLMRQKTYQITKKRRAA